MLKPDDKVSLNDSLGAILELKGWRLMIEQAVGSYICARLEAPIHKHLS
jgi:hypothetical protein